MVKSMKKRLPGEVALALAVILNAFNVTLVAKSQFGITTLSSVPLVLAKAFPFLTFGTWNFLVQTLIILLLMVLTRSYKAGYLLSFGIGLIFGRLLDFFELLLLPLPLGFFWRLLYFVAGAFLMTVGASLFIRCQLPALPFDTFVRDMTQHFQIPVSKVRTTLDLTCVTFSLVVSFAMLGRMEGVGPGTLVTALFTGTITQGVLKTLDRHFVITPLWGQRKRAAGKAA